MEQRIKIVGLGGSMARTSHSLMALKVVMSECEAQAIESQIFDIRQLNLPMYAPDIEPPEVAHQFAEAVCQSHGMIWSSPLYHGTVSGAFKNALDWLQLLADREPAYLTNKIIGLISTAGGTQGLQAINTMEFAVRALRGWAVPLVIPVAQAWKVFSDDGSINDPQVEAQLRGLGREVVRAVRQFSVDGVCDYSR